MVLTAANGSFVPQAAVSRCSNLPVGKHRDIDHLVGAGQARTRVREPIAFAVLRLMTSSNLVGSWTGRSAGFAPLRMRSTYDAARRNRPAVLFPKDSKPPLSAK